MLMRVLNQGRVRTHRLKSNELIRILKEAAPLCAKPMGYRRVKVKQLADGSFVQVGRDADVEDPLDIAMDATEID